jgi:hypothetical protein
MNRRHVLPQLGGTLRIYFLFAYYYALLNLCRFAECHYPRLVILDLVPDIAKGETMRDRVGLVLEPFVFGGGSGDHADSGHRDEPRLR